MNRSSRMSLLAFIAAGIVTAACADVTSTAPVVTNASASFAKSGTATGGGGSTSAGSATGGGNSTGTTTPASAPSGPPVAPTFTARIDSIGIVPTAVYYGAPAEWTVGGYLFETNFLTHLKPTAGPLVVGACVAVSFTQSGGLYFASELKTVDTTKCE